MRTKLSLLTVAIVLIVSSACNSSTQPAPPRTTPIPRLIVRNGIVLQQGNDFPKYRYIPRTSSQLEDNRTGYMNRLDEADFTDNEYYPYQYVNQGANLGFKWVRLTETWFDWGEVESTGDFSDLYVPPILDEVISGFLNEGIQIMYDLVYWDDNIMTGENYSRFKTEEEIQRYIEYVRFTANHYRGRVHYYELLNEPNCEEGTQQYVEVADYIELAKRTIPVIRQEDPDARIVVGAVPIFSYIPGAYEYFLAIASSDIMPLVDGLSWHAGSGASPEYLADFYYSYPAQVSEIMETASAAGFEGEFIAEEVHYRTPQNPVPGEYSQYAIVPAVKYFARDIVMHLGMDIMTGYAIELENWDNPNTFSLTLSNAIKNLNTVLAGARPMVPQYESAHPIVRSYAFSYPDGSQMIALWIDGIASENDPGIPVTLTFPEFTAGTVTGVDVLNSFDQEMIISMEDHDLVIRDLHILDYPIFLRFEDASSRLPAWSLQASAPLPSINLHPPSNILSVINTADSGQGSLRNALNNALYGGDTILFDPMIFPPDNPATITLHSPLPGLFQGNITIDASDAGVILDGTLLEGHDAFGLDIMSSGNTIRGLQFTNFSGYAVGLFGGAQGNMIGGDPTIGAGPTGQGNLILSNGVGISIWDAETSRNTITGNFIGTNSEGLAGFGNSNGIYIQEGSNHIIGPDNVIAFNKESGIIITQANSLGNTITQNSIYANAWNDIQLDDGGNAELNFPSILDFNLNNGTISGTTCANCIVEIYSGDSSGGEIYEGQVIAGDDGYFNFDAGESFIGPRLTTTATDPSGNTSSFSVP